jgi:hypothetical protein
MESTQESLDRISREMCWYPFACCDNKAEIRIKEPVGSDTMQYCEKHDAEMRDRFTADAIRKYLDDPSPWHMDEQEAFEKTMAQIKRGANHG